MASVVGVVLNTIYSIVDGMFVGQCVGEQGLAAVNIVWPAVTIILGTGLMLGIGSSALIAIAIGKKETTQAEVYLGVTVKAILVIGVLLMCAGFLVRDPLLRLLGADEAMMPMARDYFTVFYSITIPYLFSTALNPIVRTDGRPDLSMMMIGVGAVANIILDYLLVMVFDYGVKGAALATSASIMLSMTVSLYYFIKGSSTIKIRREHLKLDLKILKEICSIGFVSFAIQLSYGGMIFIQNNVIYAYGTTVDIAIYTVASYINCFFVNVCTGIAQGIQPLIGYHYGANKKERMRHILYITLGVSVVAGILVYIGILLSGKTLVSTFGIDEANIQYGYESILLYCLGSPIVGIIFTMSGYYQAIGRNVYANALSVSRGFIFQFILTLALPPLMSVTGVYLSLPVAELLTVGVLGIILIIEFIKNRQNQDNLQPNYDL